MAQTVQIIIAWPSTHSPENTDIVLFFFGVVWVVVNIESFLEIL
jgi:hypothetical protein